MEGKGERGGGRGVGEGVGGWRERGRGVEGEGRLLYCLKKKKIMNQNINLLLFKGTLLLFNGLHNFH